MMFFQAATALFTLALAGVKAQDNDQDSLCDKYTKAIFMDNNATSQKTLLTLVVNTALIGNYSPAANQTYPAFGGILGGDGDLAKYFDGSMDTTNKGGMKTKVNFLDGGGATPLMNNTAANDMNTNQYRLVTHLYQYFGALLGCSEQSDDDDSVFMKYQGDGSMSKVHRFMDLNAQEINYFISQVGAAAASFGVSSADITTVADTLNSTFNYKCLPPKSVAGSAEVSQSICLAESCPEASPSNCTASTNSFPDAAAAATTDTSAENDSNSNTNNNGDDADQSTGGSTGGSTGSTGPTDGASHQMASYAIGATLGLGALAVATLF